MRFLKLVLLAIGITFCLSAVAVQDDLPLNSSHSLVQLEQSTVASAKALSEVSRASLFQHTRQGPIWRFAAIMSISDIFVLAKADNNFFAEPINQHWFSEVMSPGYRISRWQESNSLYKQMAIARSAFFF